MQIMNNNLTQIKNTRNDDCPHLVHHPYTTHNPNNVFLIACDCG